MRTDKQKRRYRFAGLMSVLATGYGGLVAARRLLAWGEPDMVSDLLKIMALIGVGTVFFAYVFWTLTQYRKESKLRGALAGLLTACFAVSLPQFVWILKVDIFSSEIDMTLIGAAAHALDNAVKTFYYTFSLSEGLALGFSVIVGFLMAKKSAE